MLGRVRVRNFRAIGPAALEIELAPLTLFVGRNAVGKTALLESIALTAQSALEQPQLMDLVLAGTKVALSEGALSDQERTSQLFFRGDVGLGLEVGLEISLSNTDKARFPSSPPEALQWLAEWPPKRARYVWQKDGAIGELGTWTHSIYLGADCPYQLSKTGAPGIQPPALINLGPSRQAVAVQVHGHKERVLASGLFQFGIVGLDQLEQKLAAELSEILTLVRQIFLEKLSTVSLLTPLRGAQLMHRDVGPEVQYVGPYGEMTIRLLSSIQAKSSDASERITRWAERFGLPGVTAGWAGGQNLRVVAKDPVTQSKIDLFQAASGSRQGLTLATQLLLSPKGSCLLLDEPENSMHPAFELVLADLLAEAVGLDRQIIATTHSELLVAAVGMAVRKKALHPDQVAIWQLERDTRGVRAERIAISEAGYLEGFVRSFNEVERGLFNEWQESLPKAGTSSGD